jgi:aspartate/tyrosine/aromatic aminotransferase
MTTWYGYPIKSNKKPKKVQKVYVMIGRYQGENCTLGVFSSVKKANEAVAWLLEHDMYYKNHPQDLGISTYELNGERIG